MYGIPALILLALLGGGAAVANDAVAERGRFAGLRNEGVAKTKSKVIAIAVDSHIAPPPSRRFMQPV